MSRSPDTKGADAAGSSQSSNQRWIDAGFLTVQFLLGGGLLYAANRTTTTDSTVLQVVGALVAALSLALGAVALRRMRHSFRPAPTPSSDGRLERDGIYRWLRHPMYNAVIGLVLVVCLLRPHSLVLGLGAANYLFYWIKARYEERLLHRRYPGYAKYRRRTWGVGL